MNDADWVTCGESGQGAFGSSRAGRGVNARHSGNRAFYSPSNRDYVPIDQVEDLGGHYVHVDSREQLFVHGEGGHCPINYGSPGGAR